LDAQSQLVTSAGHPVQGDAGPLTIPVDGGKISIAADGTISNEQGTIGALRIVQFEDEQALKRSANGLLNADEQQPQPVEAASIMQGMLEGSNVKSILELTRMMRVSRLYQSVGKFMEKEDERQTQMITTLGKPGGG
jgi:flagellar basal-body rod protein FlgF